MVDYNALSLPELFEQLVVPSDLDALIARAFREDLGDTGDVTSAMLIEEDRRSTAALVARQDGIVAGLALAHRLAEYINTDLELTCQKNDGDTCAPGEACATVEGPLRSILSLERTLLNFVGRLSGIATLANQYAAAVAGTHAVVCDTRKTTPGLRVLEKYAVRCGGGHLHRIGLYDAVLVKDNHISHIPVADLASALEAASSRARAAHDLLFFEVEVDTLEQFDAILAMPSGAVDIVLLDNMPPARLADAVARRDALAPTLLLEASGGVTLESIRAIAESGVDRISVGALTHSVQCLDIGLDIA